jgi:hypothetical protein
MDKKRNYYTPSGADKVVSSTELDAPMTVGLIQAARQAHRQRDHCTMVMGILRRRFAGYEKTRR